MAYLLPLASASPGFCLPAVVHCTNCALYSRPAAAMWRSCGLQGRFRWCVVSCHGLVGCGALFLVADVARRCVAASSCFAVLDGVWSCGVAWLCRCVVSQRVLCRVACIEWCCVVPGVGCAMLRRVLFCGVWLCGVVLRCVAWFCVAFVGLVGSSGYANCRVAVVRCVSLFASVVLRVSWCPVLCVGLGLVWCWVLSRCVMWCAGVSCGVPLWCVALWFVALCCFVVVDPGRF